MDYDLIIKEKGIKKRKIAEQLGITPVYFSYLLRGKMPMTPTIEDKLKSLLK
jgi:transcriptional regulator with XRE-family HTH domain